MIELSQDKYNKMVSMLTEELLVTFTQIKANSEVSYKQFKDRIEALSNTPISVLFSNDLLSEMVVQDTGNSHEPDKYIYLVPYEEHLVAMHSRILLRMLFNEGGYEDPVELHEYLKKSIAAIAMVKKAKSSKLKADIEHQRLHEAVVSFLSPGVNLEKLFDELPWLISLYLILSLNVWEEVSSVLKGSKDE